MKKIIIISAQIISSHYHQNMVILEKKTRVGVAHANQILFQVYNKHLTGLKNVHTFCFVFKLLNHQSIGILRQNVLR